MRCRWAAFAGLALLAADGAIAQQTPPVRVRGAIEKVDGNTLTVKARDGATLTVAVPDNVRVMALVRASLADIEPNSYIGITADPQDDGTQKAIAIHIFPEAMRGTARDTAPGTCGPAPPWRRLHAHAVEGDLGPPSVLRFRCLPGVRHRRAQHLCGAAEGHHRRDRLRDQGGTASRSPRRSRRPTTSTSR